MLTDVGIRKLATPATRREVPDGKVTGLYLVLQPSGRKSWALRFRANGKPVKLTIGGYPTIGLGEARRRAQEALGELSGGRNPAAEKRAARTAAKAERETAADRVERVVDLFIERHAKAKTRDWRNTKGMLDSEIVRRWKGRRLSEITRPHVVALLDEVIDRGAPVRANRVFAEFRNMSKWALARGMIDRNPCDGLSSPTNETRRDRVLTDDEVRLVWQAAEAIGWHFRAIARLLLLTGARRDEVGEMRWSEVDLQAKTWTLPPARTKNKRQHEIPLSDDAVAIIKALPRVEGKPGFVFTTTGRTPVSGFSRAKRQIDAAVLKARDGSAPEHWTLHDLRRTVATNLQKLGVRLEVTESALNHVSGSRGGIVGVYQRHEYAAEKREALDAWATRLRTIVGDDAAANDTGIGRGNK